MRYLSPLIIIFLISCGRSDEELKKEAEGVVTTFVSEVMLENFNSASDLYPDFEEFTSYRRLTNFSISNTSIDEDKVVHLWLTLHTS
jgi:hypothetical protein